jgi:hypothetical protein
LDPSFLASAALDVEMTSLEHVHLQCACKWTKFQCPKSVSFCTCSSTFCFTQSWSSTYFGHLWTCLDIFGHSGKIKSELPRPLCPPFWHTAIEVGWPWTCWTALRLSNAFNPCRDW